MVEHQCLFQSIIATMISLILKLWRSVATQFVWLCLAPIPKLSISATVDHQVTEA